MGSRFEMEPVKGSRFVATVTPAPDEGAAMSAIDAVRAEWPGATHHCWAYRLMDGRTRSADDGEPGGSAGRPILARIEGNDLHGLVVVVTRWYGGTKLGVGGLIRAYGGCAGMALDRAVVVEIPRTVPRQVTFDYADTAAVKQALAEVGLAPSAEDYGARVTLLLDVPEAEAAEVEGVLRDRTAGRATISTP